MTTKVITYYNDVGYDDNGDVGGDYNDYYHETITMIKAAADNR